MCQGPGVWRRGPHSGRNMVVPRTNGLAPAPEGGHENGVRGTMGIGVVEWRMGFGGAWRISWARRGRVCDRGKWKQTR